MKWKVSVSLVICLGLVLLMVAGLVTGADRRIVAADALGALAAGAVALTIGLRERTPAGAPAVLLLVVAIALYLAGTAHARPWLLGLTMIATFTAGFVALTSTSRRRGIEKSAP
jgi:hypothetical protein